MSSTTTEIIGIGHFLPENVVDNEKIVGMMNTSVQFITERTGILTRRHAQKNDTLRDLIFPAVSSALSAANLNGNDIDLIILNSLSPDYHDPSQACLIQPMLGNKQIPCFDIRAQCAGMIYGMFIAQQFIQNNTYNNVLLICAEMLSKRLDTSDEGRNLSILLGDGAGAMILSGKKKSVKGIIDTIIGADGSFFKLLWTQSPGSSNNSFAGDPGSIPYFRMNGKPMFDHAVKTLVSISREMLAKHNLTINDIDILIPHQPNKRILDAVITELNFPIHKVAINVDYLGNMASASLPITLSLALESGMIQDGNLALIVGYGAGAVWGATLYQF